MASDTPRRPGHDINDDQERTSPRRDQLRTGPRAGDPHRRGGRRLSRSRASLTLETIIEAAITTLDAVGAERVTLRGLAAELQSGVASLYWYASGKDELMAIVADELLGRALSEAAELESAGQPHPSSFLSYPPPEPDPRTSDATGKALLQIRRLVLCLFVQMLEHRWLAGQLIKAGPDEQNALTYWEWIGQALQKMELDLTSQFHASLAVVNYATGMGAEVSQSAINREAMDDEDTEFVEQIDHWSRFSPEQFPFVHSVLEEFQNFDDKSEFIMGIDLLLSGIERRTWE